MPYVNTVLFGVGAKLCDESPDADNPMVGETNLNVAGHERNLLSMVGALKIEQFCFRLPGLDIGFGKVKEK
ncbi:hypothetical protein [Paraburkholderia sp.]|uniref:hypothetical protein n=1 Tax=Paraburkholderia sp. TaxID=1926495 RepID=UPI003C62AF62